MDTFFAGQFDIAVIGAGHAGIEAALAAAALALRPSFLPSIWTLWAICPAIRHRRHGKGHLVRELDALGAKWPERRTSAAFSTAF